MTTIVLWIIALALLPWAIKNVIRLCIGLYLFLYLVLLALVSACMPEKKRTGQATTMRGDWK